MPAYHCHYNTEFSNPVALLSFYIVMAYFYMVVSCIMVQCAYTYIYIYTCICAPTSSNGVDREINEIQFNNEI